MFPNVYITYSTSTLQYALTELLELFLFDLEMKTCELKAEEPLYEVDATQVSGVLITSARIKQTRVPSLEHVCLILKHVYLTPCFGFEFDLSGEQDSIRHSEQSFIGTNSYSL